MSGPSCGNTEARHGCAGARPGDGGLGAMSGPPGGDTEARDAGAGARPRAGGLGAMSGPPGRKMGMNGTEPRKHTISVLVENKFGVLSRVAGLFSARGYNIESLSVGETLDPTVSRMTLVVTGDEFVIEQVMKQLHKLIDVIKVNDLTDEGHVERELMLVRVNAEPPHREATLRTADSFRASVGEGTQV